MKYIRYVFIILFFLVFGMSIFFASNCATIKPPVETSCEPIPRQDIVILLQNNYGNNIMAVLAKGVLDEKWHYKHWWTTKEWAEKMEYKEEKKEGI